MMDRDMQLMILSEIFLDRFAEKIFFNENSKIWLAKSQRGLRELHIARLKRILKWIAKEQAIDLETQDLDRLLWFCGRKRQIRFHSPRPARITNKALVRCPSCEHFRKDPMDGNPHCMVNGEGTRYDWDHKRMLKLRRCKDWLTKKGDSHKIKTLESKVCVLPM